MKKNNKINWDRIAKLSGIIMGALGLTFGTIAYIVVDHHATEWAVEKIEDDKSRVHLAIEGMIQAATVSATSKMMNNVIDNAAKYNKIYNSLTGHNGMNDERLTEYVKEMFNFADTVKQMMPTIMENHEWVLHQRDGSSASEYISCGTVLAKDGKPKYFKSCDGVKRKISYGRPSGINLNSGIKVYYYRDENDKPVLISYLSNH